MRGSTVKDGSQHDPRVESAGCAEVVSFLSVPLLATKDKEIGDDGPSNSNCLGVVFAANKTLVDREGGGSILRFNQWDEEHATLIAQHLVQAIESRRQHDEDCDMKVRAMPCQILDAPNDAPIGASRILKVRCLEHPGF